MSMESKTEVIPGKSIIVPSVQELSKEPIINIPARYVRDDQEDPLIGSYDPSLPSVPVIDVERLDVEDYMNSELVDSTLPPKTGDSSRYSLVPTIFHD